MKIIYNKDTGEVIGTVEGRVKGVTILPGGAAPDSIGEKIIEPGDPEAAVADRLLDPRDDLSISFLRIEDNELVEVPEDTKEKIRKHHRDQRERAEKAAKKVKNQPPLKEIVADLDKRLSALEKH